MSVKTADREKSIWKSERLTIMAMMVALLGVSSYIVIPLPFTVVSITAQTMIVNLVGLMLSLQEALLVMVVWTLLGLTGVPVFTGGAAGPAKVFGPSGGYIFGFIVAAVLTSVFGKKTKNFKLQITFIIVAGIPIIYAFGAAWMKLMTGQPWGAVLVQSVLPFIPLDIVKCFAAAAICRALRRTGRF